MTTTRVATASTSGILWLMKTTIVPAAARRRMTAKSLAASVGPKDFETLASRSTSEFPARHLELPAADLLLHARNLGDGLRLHRRFQLVVPDERDDPFVHAEPVDVRLELVVVDEPGHVDERRRHVEHGRGDDDLGGHVVLVFVRAEAADVALLAGLEHAAAGLVGLMEDEVAAGVDQGQRGLLRRTDVIEVAGVDLLHLELRIHRLRAGPEGEERRVDRRELDAADEAGLPALRLAR